MIYRLAPYWRVRCYRMRCWLFNYTVCVCDAACCIVCKPRSTCTSCTDSCTPLKLLCHHWWLDFKLYAWIVKTFRTAVHVQGMPSHPVLSAPQLILYMCVWSYSLARWLSCWLLWRCFALSALLTVLHDNQLTHTDLKPENILFVDSRCESIYISDKVRRRAFSRLWHVTPCPRFNDG